jgi:sn-glycerol 3-phosphate transport system ATP-binding protein
MNAAHCRKAICQLATGSYALGEYCVAFLFDEPLFNLDAQLRGHMRLEIRNLQRWLKTISVFVTHDQLEAMSLADTLVVMKIGRIERMGTPFEVYSNPATTFVAKFIGSPGMIS